MVTKAIQFLSEVRSEVKKVTWPTKKEAMGGTAVVLVVVFIMALFLGLVDLLLSKIIGVIFSA
jgi:preprotein translocase subunit SecE